MNHHKIVWETSNFKWIRILLCIVSLFVPNWGLNATFKIFDDKPRVFEAELLKSLQTTKNIFAQPELNTAVLIGLGISTVVTGVPYVQTAASLAFVAKSLLSRESDWKEGFARTLAYETQREIAESTIRWMEATMASIEEKFELMSNNTNIEIRRTPASIIHSEINVMLNAFARNTFFKYNPLIGSPPLIALALVVALFDPMAKSVIPEVAMVPELSCKMRNILLDYLPRAIHARIYKRLHVKAYRTRAIPPNLDTFMYDRTMSVKYNQYGYNATSKHPCLGDCVKDQHHGLCLYDDFGEDTFVFPACAYDYALLVRHRVEELFPVELLSKLCVKPPQTTGTYCRFMINIFTFITKKKCKW